ncbi:Membrane carboxypeptidase (penicillin-binding protein) [Haloechinothrix alba]|uniref:Membrane carboxypeptidase (Penicillin-binding protein) n=1 Tax=Haloechinothrix alba TaxID=664784 RepID=A0A238V012_9PSEU|nr:transglycosylase domain-containing protein [Haloechinothrix alba]SNR27374.1 Membrane carboxypeptidase (penicillin-binding protein) [Haloechinothrix alba]
MSDERRPGRHSYGGGNQPQWPSGEEPRWPTGEETQWERPPAGPARHGPPQWPGAQHSDPRGGQQPPAGADGPAGPTGPAGGMPGYGDPGQPPQQGGGGAPGRPHGSFDDDYVTEMLPPIDRDDYEPFPGAEPQLLTHRDDGAAAPADPAAEQRINAYLSGTAITGAAGSGVSAAHAESGADPGGDSGGGGDRTKPGRKRGVWLRRAIYTFVALFVVLPMAAFGITYLFVDVPTPHEVAEAQGGVVPYFYANGDEMGRDAPDGNRVVLSASEIPAEMKHAAYAAEDETFETNRGFDLTAIARAAYLQLTGGSGGGSTITQQYIKVATDSDEHTLQRKATEVVRAFKMNNQQTKSEIITAYLNTIYLGRGAYGVQAAAQAYYGKDVEELDKHEAAFLAGIIQAPSRSDNRDYAERRWNYVMDQMVANDWMSGAERAESTFPEPLPPEATQMTTMGGPKHYIKERINEELEEIGYSESEVRANSYQIHTTIEQRAQDIAQDSVREVMDGQPEMLRKALVAVDPNSGAVRAYYGGEVTEQNQRDWAHTARNPGSTMKPFDFVALLQQGKGPGETYDGSSPRTFGEGDEPVTINNVNGDSCANCTVAEAMKRSLNTVFYDIVVNDTGPAAVAKAARSAGMSERSELSTADAGIAIGGGATTVTPRDMAAAFATFAADGIQRDSHLISKLTTDDGETIYQHRPEGEPAFASDEEESEQIAGNVTQTLEPVLPYSNLSCAGGRPCAGKTGTHQSHEEGENSQAWMAGYTPSISIAVWVGDSGSDPIRDANGAKIYGSGLPGQIWKDFTDTYLEGTPHEDFTEVETIGEPAQPPRPTEWEQGGGDPDDAPPPRDENGREDEGRDNGGNGGGDDGTGGDGEGDDGGQDGGNGGGDDGTGDGTGGEDDGTDGGPGNGNGGQDGDDNGGDEDGTNDFMP